MVEFIEMAMDVDPHLSLRLRKHVLPTTSRSLCPSGSQKM
jgi:hypothetical protein